MEEAETEEGGDLGEEDVHQLFSKLSDICKLLKQKGEEVVVLTSKDKQVNHKKNEEFITHNVDMLTKFKQFCEDQQSIQPVETGGVDFSDVTSDSGSVAIPDKHNTEQELQELGEEEFHFDENVEDDEYHATNTFDDHSQFNDETLNDTNTLDRQNCTSKNESLPDESKMPPTRLRQSFRTKKRLNYKSFTKEEEVCHSKKTKLDKNNGKSKNLVKSKRTKSESKMKTEQKSIKTGRYLLKGSYAENEGLGNNESNTIANVKKLPLKKEVGSERVGIKSGPDNVENQIKCNICGTIFIHKEHLRIHLLKIPNCDTFLKGVDSLQDNNLETLNIKYTDLKTNEAISTPLKELLNSQLKEPFKCIVCKKSFNKKSNFKRHMVMHSDNLQPVCNICGTKFKSRENAMKHRKDHDNNPFHCELCDKHRFKTAEELEDHRKNCSRPKYTVEDLTCDVCGHISKCRAALQIHKNVHLGIRPYPCEHCGKKMSSNASLERHIMSMHQDLTPFKCEICHKAFKVKDNYKKHMKHHGEPQYKCEICGKTCTELGNMKKHMMSHTKEKPFVCELCGKKYSRKALLDTHRRLHTGEKPYECKEKNCGKTFRSYENLKQHMGYHSTDMPFVCDVCGKSFKQPGRMTHHRKSHFVEYGWHCLFCKEKFKTIFKYKGHLAREHPFKKAEIEAKTSIRLHKCDLCGKVYGEKEDLKRHIYIHKGLKPFKCVHCFKGFNDKSNLKQHMKIHSNENQFVCEICQETFPLRRDLRMHVCTTHDQLIPGEKYAMQVKPNKFRPKIVRARPSICNTKLDTIIPRLNKLTTQKLNTRTKENIKQSNAVKDKIVTCQSEMESLESDQGPVTRETHVVVQKEPSSNNFVLAPAQLQIFKPGDYLERKEINEQANTGPLETIPAQYQMASPQALFPIGPMMTVEVGLVQPCFYVKK